MQNYHSDFSSECFISFYFISFSFIYFILFNFILSFSFDELLDGGLYTSEVLEIAGGSGVGKTQVSNQGR